MLIVALTGCVTAQTPDATTVRLPKHEFRGAWMHIIGQKQYAEMSPEQTREYLIKQLDRRPTRPIPANWNPGPAGSPASPARPPIPCGTPCGS